MVIRLSLLLLLVSCGNNVKLKDNKLEDFSKLDPSHMASYQKQGIFIKGPQNQLQYQGRTYIVSKYSSKMTTDFINTVPAGSQVPVIFTGGVDNNEVVIETIKRQ